MPSPSYNNISHILVIYGMITFRDATTDDTNFVALCTLASTGLYDFTQPLPEVLFGSLVKLCSRPDTLYSYSWARIAVVDGEDVGAIVSYPGSFYRSGREVTFGLMKDVMGMDFSDSDIECEPNEFYLDCLAVLPEYQGRGLGLELIRDALKKAKSQAYNKAACIVGADEKALMRYYEQVGFQTDRKVEVFGCDYVKMINLNF